MNTPPDGEVLIVSTRENTIRVLDGYKIPMEPERRHGIPPPRPDDPTHYSNQLPRPACDVIRELVESAKKLEVIPIADGYSGSFVKRDTDARWRIIMRKMVEMGWPDHFRVDEWREIVKDVFDDAGDAVSRKQEGDG
jgi:hypothetical protein